MASLTPTHTDRLTPAALELLRRLGGRRWAPDAYLAGSAALTLYLGHREVRDLDLMSGSMRLASPERRDLLEDLLAVDSAMRVETARDGYLFVRSGGGVGVRFFYYPYPLVDPEEEAAGITVASAVDLGLMKLGAIISRGTRRDFVDLYTLCRALPLAELLARSRDKFGHVRDFPVQALKGLVDFSLLDGEPMPPLVGDASETVTWERVEGWLTRSVRELARERFAIEEDDR